MKRLILIVIFMFALAYSATAESPYNPPPEVQAEYGFAKLDESTMKTLLSQGTLIIVRQNPDLTLINVTSAQVVNAPLKVIWEVINDFDKYPEFMPQTEEEKVIEKKGENDILVEQTIGVKIWRLPTVDITYRLAQQLTPPDKVRFWYVEGDLEGTYGGWDLVEAGGQTMIFYTLYSNLTALDWGLGSIFKTQPDFMAGVNVTTAMMVTKAVKEESEKRAGK